ncbi:hypothetical protein JST97_31335 [bacterium]|nr:hypothetical protein [bacterium]
MHHITLLCFGGFLIAVGLALGIREIRNPIRLTGVVRRTRRRLVGATLLCVLGALISHGPLPQAPVAKEVLMQSATYWAGVLGLTLGLVVLAFWDTVDGVRALNNHLDLAENASLKQIRDQLKQS